MIKVVISLRLLLIVMVAVIAVTAGLVAFFPLYFAAQSAAIDTANDFSDTITAGIATRVGPFFFSAQNALDAVLHAIAYNDFKPSVNVTIWNWLSYGYTASGFACSAYYDTGVWLSVQRQSTLTNVSANSPDDIMTVYGSASAQLILVDIRNASNLSVIKQSAVQRTNYVPSQRPFWKMIRTSRSWTAPFLDTAGKQAILMAGCPWVVAPGGPAVGALSLRVESVDVLQYLQQLRVGVSGRVVLIEASQNQYIGGNFMESPVLNGSLKSISDIQEPLIQSAFSALRSIILQCDAPCRLTFGSGRSLTFVRVAAITDAYGLNLRVVVVIPATDFLQNIWTGSEIGVGASFGAVAALAVVFVVLLRVILQPLAGLQPRLQRCAMLGDFPQQAYQRCWQLQEVTAIEDACTKLSADLKKVKSFLPQSVVDQLDSFPLGEGAASVHDARSAAGATVGDGSEMDTLSNNSVAFSEVGTPQLPTLTFADDGFANDRAGAYTGVAVGGNTSTAASLQVTAIPCPRKVTVAFVDLIGTYQCLDHFGSEAITHLLDRATSTILQVTKLGKGVVDWVSGDRFILSFNASAPCASHATRTMSVVLALSRHSEFCLSQDINTPRFSSMAMGVATSQALCGYYGCERMKRFGILGQCMNQAHVLMETAKRERLHSLLSPATRDAVQSEYEMMHAVIVDLPNIDQPAIVSTVMSECCDLWPTSSFTREEMEALATERAVVAKINSAFESIVKGDLVGAKQLADNAKKKKPHHLGVALAQRAITAASQKPRKP